uniref:ANK_REP_REGION domain-containing protein n=1 Tax=Schistocephalus solidus TaxID=70667 RepID=A0A183TB73_SCHSO
LLRYPPQGCLHNGTQVRGANPRLTDDEGRCPLHIAAWQGHSELVALLLQVRTRVTSLPVFRWQFILISLCCARLLYISELTLWSHLHYAGDGGGGGGGCGALSTGRVLAALQGQIRAGTPVDVRDKEDRTPLHSAAWQNHAAVCSLLLQAGADVNAVCSQGATALCIAAQEGHFDVCEVLLQHGANANQVDVYGRPPFKVALKAGHRKICALLERYGGRAPTDGSPRLRPRRKPTAAQVQLQPLATDAQSLGDRSAPMGLALAPPAPIQSRNMARLSFEHKTSTTAVETAVNSATFVMNKSRQGLSPLRVVAPPGRSCSWWSVFWMLA